MIELDPLYLVVLPLLFAAGWWLRGYDARLRARDPQGEQRSYFRGLNFLLNEQPDKAIDAFVEVVKLDPETIDLHFALGNLFRRRGEIDRAVRIHTHLLNRADLPTRSREQALAELGQDFLKGGLLDRAEEAYAKLLDNPTHRVEALRALVRIYEMEREWRKAIDMAKLLDRETGETRQVQIAHFHCELAEQAIKKGDRSTAEMELRAAQSADRKSVRAAMLAGDLAAQSGDMGEAIADWQRVERDAPRYLPLVAAKLTDALHEAGRFDEAMNFLRRNLLDHPSIDLLDIAYARILKWDSAEAAERLLRDELQRHPSLLGFERLLSARAALNNLDPQLDQLRSVIRSHSSKLARYRCSQCGFRSKTFSWQCPGCNSWESYPPRRMEELDVA